MKKKAKKFPDTLLGAITYFSNKNRALAFMKEIRWPQGVVCPTCGSREVTFLANAQLWKCKTRHPRQKFSAKVGTVFEDSPIGLDKWLPAMWLAVNCKNGVSSYEIARDLGVTQKTAWFMLHRIRLAMQDSSIEPMSGKVEADETFIGGKARNMHKDKKSVVPHGGLAGKVAVMGLLERNAPDKHSRVTNGLENFWSLLKRGIKGTYVNVEPFHLFRYLDEQAFRFNERKDNDAGRFVKAMSGIVGKGLRYANLIGKEGSDGLPNPSAPWTFKTLMDDLGLRMEEI